MVFIVEEDRDGWMTAHAVGSSIFTQGDTPEQLREIPDEKSRPKVIRLHHVRDELLVA